MVRICLICILYQNMFEMVGFVQLNLFETVSNAAQCSVTKH